MKKTLVIISAVLFILIASFCLFADFGRYSPGTRTLPASEGDIVFSVTAFDGKSESEPFVKCLGHSWISLENRTGHPVTLLDYEIADGETVTFSVWAITGHRGVTFNLEAGFIREYGRYSGRRSLSVRMDESRLSEVEDYLRANDTWTPGMNCSLWSLGLWNRIASEEGQIKKHSLLYTPSRLQKAIEEFDCAEADADFSDAKEIFFYEDGERRVLRLCS